MRHTVAAVSRNTQPDGDRAGRAVTSGCSRRRRATTWPFEVPDRYDNSRTRLPHQLVRNDPTDPHERRWGPCNELLANYLLGLLGAPRAGLAIVHVDRALRSRSPDLHDVICDEAFGEPAIDPAPPNLPRHTIPILANMTPDDVLLAQDAVLRWLGNTDHSWNNWMEVGGRVYAIDFAATPLAEVWTRGAAIARGLHDEYGGMNTRLSVCPPAAIAGLRSRLDAITRQDIGTILARLPGPWATATERGNVLGALMRRKGGVRGHY